VLGGLTVWGPDDGLDKKGRDFDRVEPLARDSVPSEYVLPIFFVSVVVHISVFNRLFGLRTS
jgi:hypothetical protein